MPANKRPRELEGLGPVLPYAPGHRGATVTARVSNGPPAPRCELGREFGARPRKQSSTLHQAADAPASAGSNPSRALWQPQWTWLPLEGCGDYCFRTKWFYRTLATARPSTGGPGTSAEVAAKRQREWEQRQRDEGIVNGKQYGRWEQTATGSKRWRRGVPKDDRPWSPPNAPDRGAR